MATHTTRPRDWAFAALSLSPWLLAVFIPLAMATTDRRGPADAKIAMLYGGLLLGLLLIPLGLVQIRGTTGRRRTVLGVSIAIAISPVAFLLASLAAMWAMAGLGG